MGTGNGEICDVRYMTDLSENSCRKMGVIFRGAAEVYVGKEGEDYEWVMVERRFFRSN